MERKIITRLCISLLNERFYFVLVFGQYYKAAVIYRACFVFSWDPLEEIGFNASKGYRTYCGSRLSFRVIGGRDRFVFARPDVALAPEPHEERSMDEDAVGVCTFFLPFPRDYRPRTVTRAMNKKRTCNVGHSHIRAHLASFPMYMPCRVTPFSRIDHQPGDTTLMVFVFFNISLPIPLEVNRPLPQHSPNKLFFHSINYFLYLSFDGKPYVFNNPYIFCVTLTSTDCNSYGDHYRCLYLASA